MGVVRFAVDLGELDLNIWEPVISKNIFDSFSILTNAISLFTEKCLDGITVNETICLNNAERSLSLSVVLSSLFGYEVANEIALEAHEKHITIKEVVVRKGILDEKEAAKWLNPVSLTDPAKMHQLVKEC